MKISDAVDGHNITEAVRLATSPPRITTAREGRRIAGDIGRLMPLAESDYLQDLAAWIEHLSISCVPCVVVRRGDRFVLYKERRVRTGCQWQTAKS
jgi:hypothetical protein